MTIAHSCADGMTSGRFTCVDEALCEDLRNCDTGRRLQDTPFVSDPSFNFDESIRRLAAEEGPASPALQFQRHNALRRLDGMASVSENTWEFLAEHAYQPTVLFFSAFIASIVWLYALGRAPKIIVWGTLIADVLAVVAIFIWYLVDFWIVNVPCVIIATAMCIGMLLLRQNINNACIIFQTAITGFSANIRLGFASFGVQCVWVAYFAVWIASLIEMHYVQVAVEDSPGYCKLETAGWVANAGTHLLWITCYYWTTYFAQCVNLVMVTASISGWYFKQKGYESFWLSGLKWAVGPHAGGTAGASFMMGLSRYLLDRVGSMWNIIFSILNPIHWIGLCLALVLKTVMQTYAKVGLIAHTFSGKSFCESAPKAFNLLKWKLGDALLCDYLGSRIMAWMTYFISLGVAFAAWSWADHAQDIEGIDEVPAAALILLVIFYAWLLSYPILVMVVIVLIENQLEGSSMDTKTRGHLNSIFASLFMGAVTLFVLTFVSQLVVSACDVVFFCFAVEAEHQQAEQERFGELYKSIKQTVVPGMVPGAQGVVVGHAPTQTVHVVIPEGMSAGQTMRVQAPSGSQVNVVLPEGSQPGQTIAVLVPAAQVQQQSVVAAVVSPQVVGNVVESNEVSAADV